ncbi:1931_t:CDS:2 [Funneliformis mosseae]|uniref:1931_t:CDS:1 n=1 Tax=Funneliformis mosseae TaxID=27381 RepID=A0A9N9EY43_FUNMO|nr:1931_t:CDS:2 [Funneliformis mosseae]
MFLIESFRDYRTTEPIWFRYLRSLFAIVLTTILIVYSINKLHNFNVPTNPITFTYSQLDENNGFTINICTGISNEIQLRTTDPTKVLLSAPFNLTTDTKYLKEDVYTKDRLEPTYFSFDLGQIYLITFKPMIKFNSYGTPYILELMPRVSQMPISLKPNELTVGFIFPSNILKFEELKYKFTDLISDFGGFYGIFYLLFGMQKLEPWGLIQKYLLTYIPFRQSFTRKFAERYVTYVGLPLVEKIKFKGDLLPADPEPPVENNSPFPTTSGSEILTPLKDEVQILEKLEYLKDRVQMLEIFLKDYYLDDYLLKKVRFAKRKYDEKIDDEKREEDMLSWV